MRAAVSALACAAVAALPAAAARPPRQILYVSYAVARSEARVLDLDRGRVTTVAAGLPGRDVTSPTWDPRGARIVYGTATGLVVVAPDGTAAHRITGAADDPVAWSRDGRWIAFRRYVARRTRIFVAHPDGSGTRNVVAASDAAWSADSRHLYVTDARRGIVVVDLHGDATPLPHGRHSAEPQASPDGKWVVFAAIRDPKKPWVTRIAAEHPDGTAFRWLTGGGDRSSDANPAWAPDNRSVAFARGYSGRDQDYSGIVTVRLDGTQVRPLEAQLVGHDERPRWSPDGRTIVFDRDAAVEPIGESVELMVVDVASRQARRVAFPIVRWSQSWRPR